jgi:ribosomal-protein-alanine N-acetyltransferase
MSACLEGSAIVTRALAAEDLDDVVRIEQESYPFPWTRGIFADCLRVGYSCWALDYDEQFAGYSILTFGPEETHLLNICIAPAFRGLGLGLQLLNWSIEKACVAKSKIIFLEVRPSNTRAIEIYHRRGFQMIGQRPKYYPTHDGREDAYLMAMQLDFN